MSDSNIRSTKTALPLQSLPAACYLVSATPSGDIQRRADGSGSLRSIGRPDTLTSQRVEVGLVLQAMLGVSAATDYFSKHDVCPQIATRVLSPKAPRRGTHDANGVRAGYNFPLL